jgi:NAD(P)-dependent dehydrogenase (short-subunit alcohol dehydrogenase family)
VSDVIDVRDNELVRRFMSAVQARFGVVDILVNNAGGGFQAQFVDVSEKGQDALIRENFTQVTHCIRAAVPLMTSGRFDHPRHLDRGASRGSRLRDLLGDEGRGGEPRQEPRARARRPWDPVNCIAPDVIPTPGIGEIPVRTPLPRPGHVDDVAGAVVFLASDLAQFVTGATLHVDGGNWAAGGWRRGPDGFST